MKSMWIIGMLLCSFAFSSTVNDYSNYHYKEVPDKSYVDDVHYDKELNVIIVHVHAKVLFLSVDQTYGIRVDDNTDVEKKIKEVMGREPRIVRLERVK